MTYMTCKKLIETGKRLGNFDKESLLQKLDIFLLGGRITMEEYTELVKMME